MKKKEVVEYKAPLPLLADFWSWLEGRFVNLTGARDSMISFPAGCDEAGTPQLFQDLRFLTFGLVAPRQAEALLVNHAQRMFTAAEVEWANWMLGEREANMERLRDRAARPIIIWRVLPEFKLDDQTEKRVALTFRFTFFSQRVNTLCTKYAGIKSDGQLYRML